MVENSITQEYVKNLTSYTDTYLCKIKDNIFDIKFLKFKVRDLDSGFTLFEVASDIEEDEEPVELSDEDRLIKYHLGPDFLELKKIGTELTFSVGAKPVKNLVMIERHYFKDTLIKDFEFRFPFCIPNTTNTWESIYELPQIAKDLEQ